MTFSQSIEYIHSLGRFGINPGLERIAALCAAFGNPQKSLSFVHVAGTNGKGSTSTMLANMLIRSGKRVGLFTSPYVVSFMERIQVDGKPADETLFAQTVTRLEPVVASLAQKGMQPTEFEVITAAAFLIFRQCGCDTVVLEVGLGGRLDSTNIISTPLVSVITSISTDHAAILGDTVEKIAAEKCGIVKAGGRTVCYPFQPGQVAGVVLQACRERGNEMTVPDVSKITAVKSDICGSAFCYDGLEIKLSMGGEYQIYNAVTAVDAARILGIKDEHIAAGISDTAVAARMEIISRTPLVILDGGHNEDGGRAVAQSLAQRLGGKKIHAVIGMMADKNFDAYLSHVAPLCSKITAVSVADNPRSLSAEELKTAAEKYCGDVAAVEDACSAVQSAAKSVCRFDCLLVCGSLYLAGEVREKMKKIFTDATK